MDSEEAVILVVGVDETYKARVAEALADGRGASIVETSKGGARIFRRESSPEAVVVDTTTLENVNGDELESARVWVSLNSLRRMCGKHVYVVCVLSSSGLDDSMHQKISLNSTYSPLNHLVVTFKEHQRVIMLLVKLDGQDKRESKKSAIRDVLVGQGFARSNISFETFERQDLLPAVKLALEKSVHRSFMVGNAKKNKMVGNAKDSNDTLKPFLLKEVGSNAKNMDVYGPWGPDRVILFGRTGSGKSTLAQMLTMGKLDPLSTNFASSSSIRGETKKLQCGQGRAWHVVDTPGFGEPKDKLSTVSTGEAEKKLRRYVQLINGCYSHFIYVVAKDRIDQLEMNLWEFFSQLFGVDRITHFFTVVVSNATESWMKENKEHLQDCFKGCESFLSGEFPATKTDDEEWEEELQEYRLASLKQLEEELCSLKREVTICDLGLYSKGTSDGFLSGLSEYVGDMLSMKDRLKVEVMKSYCDFRRLTLTLTRDDKVVLLPL